MKMLNTKPVEFASSGITGAQAFGFELNGIAFDAVINGIYSNKVGAPVREYATNAYDAHKMVGKDDVPFILMAPSMLNPFFMVRDFGPGMDNETVKKRATTMFGSDKRDRNDQVGCLGLGMKSGFAYSDQYTITCFDGVTKREYICFKNDTGEPNVSDPIESPSDEPTGVMIKIPVKQADIGRFKVEIEKVMLGFDPMPKIVNNQWHPAGLKVLMQGDNYRIVKHDYISRPYVRQGCVLYPLELDQIDDRVSSHYKDIPIIIDVPIGTASVQTSREKLGYDEPTKANLLAIWNDVRQKIEDEIQGAVDEPDNYLDACVRYRELSNRLGKIMPKELKWRGQFKLRASFPYDGSTGTKVRVDVIHAHHELLWDPPRQPRGRARYYQTVPSLDPEALKDLTVLWEPWDCSFAKDRIRMYRSLNKGASILWVKTEKKEDFVNLYGIETVVDLREIERLKLPRSAAQRRRITKADIRMFDPYRSIYTDFAEEKAVYVFSEGPDYEVLGKTLEFEQVRLRYTSKLRTLGIIDDDTRIIVLVKNQRDLPAKNPGWVHLDKLINEAVAAFDPKGYAKKGNLRNFLDSYLVRHLVAQKDNLPKSLRDFLTSAGSIEPAPYTEYTRFELWQTVTGKHLPPVKNTLNERFNKFLARWPLLETLVNNEDHLIHYLKLIAR